MSTWIVAIETDGEWQEHATSDSLEKAVEMAKSTEGNLIGVFRNRDGWQECKPSHLIDRRDKSDWPIQGLGELISSLDSSWF